LLCVLIFSAGFRVGRGVSNGAAQQTYLQDSDQLNQAKWEHAFAAVALYRSLGGGWNENAAARVASRNEYGQTSGAAVLSAVSH
jgi:hypothetical protein